MTEIECGKLAAFYFTWVTGKSGYICHDHTEKLQSVAAVLGVHVELEVAAAGALCQQKVTR